jgi:hypothetical protein
MEYVVVPRSIPQSVPVSYCGRGHGERLVAALLDPEDFAVLSERRGSATPLNKVVVVVVVVV